MGYESAYNEIRTRFNTAWANATPIAWPNVNFTPPSPQAPWVRLYVDDGESQQMSLGSNLNVIRYAGVIFVQIFTVQDKGDKAALQFADNVVAIFNNWCGVNVRCRTARVRSIGHDGNGWYQVNVAIPFYRDAQL